MFILSRFYCYNMIQSKNLIACINDLNDAGHVMESCEFIHEGVAYSIKFKKLKKKVKH